jgi:hypothetical protein
MSSPARIVLRGRRSQCVACGKVFTCPSAFDKHRRGSYDAHAQQYGRFCLPVDALPAWQQNRYGLWFLGRKREVAT